MMFGNQRSSLGEDSTPEPSEAIPYGSVSAPSERYTVSVLVGLIVLKLGLLTVYAMRSRWVMDEFGQGYMARYVGHGLYRQIIPVKTAIPMLLFWLPLRFGDSVLSILNAWRVEVLLAAFLTIGTVAYASRRLDRRPASWLFALFTLLTFSNFLERSYRVRNDSFAVLLAVMAFAVCVGYRRLARGAWISGALVGLAFLCTQKSIYYVLAFAVFQWILGWEDRRWKGSLGLTLRYLAGAGVPLLAYSIGFGGLRFDRVLTAVFLSPLWPGVSTAMAHPGLGRYILQTLERNPISYLVCVAGIVWALSRWKTIDPRLRAAAVATVIVTACVFLHSQPWPYVFVMAIPFLAIWSPLTLRVIPRKYGDAALVAILIGLSLSFVRNASFLEENKADQFEVVREAESLLGPTDHYFDGIGMIPTRDIAGRHPWWWWDAPMLETLRRRWNGGDRSEIERILNDHPKVWILNYRFRPMAPILGPIWQQSTVRVSPYLLLSGRQLSGSGPAVFENLWPGPYDLFDAQGRQVQAELSVDGSLCTLPCSIPAGWHMVTADRASYLLPADFQSFGPIPYRGAAPDLFAAIYDY